jgi:hypothetical protein
VRRGAGEGVLRRVQEAGEALDGGLCACWLVFFFLEAGVVLINQTTVDEIDKKKAQGEEGGGDRVAQRSLRL